MMASTHKRYIPVQIWKGMLAIHDMSLSEATVARIAVTAREVVSWLVL